MIDQEANILSQLTPLSILRLVGFDTLISRPFHGDSFEYKSGCLHTLKVSRTKNEEKDGEPRGQEQVKRRKEEERDEMKNSFFVAHCNRKPRWSAMQDIFYSPYFGFLCAYNIFYLILIHTRTRTNGVYKHICSIFGTYSFGGSLKLM